jgi:hypothetical protein
MPKSGALGALILLLLEEMSEHRKIFIPQKTDFVKNLWG